MGNPKEQKVRTRFAPSPTGSMHIGNLRTAFYAYALAKKYDGDFILRIEDTDKKREQEGGIEEIKSLLSKFLIKWDEFYIQSERLEKYKQAAERLVSEGHAFYCQCKGKNAKEGFSNQLRDPCRDKNLKIGAIKLKVPENETVSFRDFILDEEVEWGTDVVFDATLLKSDGYPTYHLAVVVDDHDMKISHVLRGHDWMPSTPIHLLVYNYLGFDVPQIGHLTDILDPEGGKLSKRKGSVSVQGLLDEGYLPEAIFNFVILVGWAPKDNKEFYSLSNFVKMFDEKGFQRSNPVFNRDKLLWFNGEYIRKTQNSKLKIQIYEFFDRIYDEDLIEKIIPLVKERMNTLKEFESLAGFFFQEPDVERDLFGEDHKKHLISAKTALEVIDEWGLENINKSLIDTIQKEGYKTGKFFMDLRIAVTGKKITPPINESMEILGRDKTLRRINKVLE